MQQRAAFVGSNFFRPQFIAIFRTSDLACNISRGLFASVKYRPGNYQNGYSVNGRWDIGGVKKKNGDWLCSVKGPKVKDQC